MGEYGAFIAAYNENFRRSRAALLSRDTTTNTTTTNASSENAEDEVEVEVRRGRTSAARELDAEIAPTAALAIESAPSDTDLNGLKPDARKGVNGGEQGARDTPLMEWNRDNDEHEGYDSDTSAVSTSSSLSEYPQRENAMHMATLKGIVGLIQEKERKAPRKIVRQFLEKYA
ncbi:hypothetical protein BDW74DRAFT_177712 [Aspergillus multicolor]|uniref:uncharacterized protein n=1 Tax=Aspergillus multicolor TaxID=41759 RepID=UPI003CCDDCBA